MRKMGALALALGAVFSFSVVAFGQSQTPVSDVVDSASRPLVPQNQRLFRFENDRDAGGSVLEALTDSSGRFVGARYIRQPISGPGSADEFTAADLKRGVVLEAQQGVNAIQLKGTLDSASGGTMTFTYVANGLSGEYKSCDAQLTKSGDWIVVNPHTRAPVHTVKIVTWSTGITTLQGLCPK